MAHHSSAMDKNSKVRVKKNGETIPRTPRIDLPPVDRTYREVAQQGANNQGRILLKMLLKDVDIENQGSPDEDKIELFEKALRKIGENQKEANEGIGRNQKEANERVGRNQKEANERVG
ncbi:hypothetical protein AKO1_007499, partial [Acrasis kona]